jgi:class 3 adenylate cyclase
LLIVFDSIEGAVRCAVTIQQQVPNSDEEHASDRRIRFRMGVDIGNAIADGTDLHGDGVIVAARLQAECPPGGVCASRAVRDHVHDRLDLGFEALGLLSLEKGRRAILGPVLRVRGLGSPGDVYPYQLRAVFLICRDIVCRQDLRRECV